MEHGEQSLSAASLRTQHVAIQFLLFIILHLNMDFAKNLLKKYGWQDGDGLGKNNTGIAKPLKANLKFDNAGLGVDKANEFNNHWWQRVFNEAAENVQVNNDERQVSLALKNTQDEVEISTKSYSMKKLQKVQKDKQKQQEQNVDALRYGNFLQSSTLTKQGEQQHNVDLSDIAVKQYKVLTDEELFAACDGRTAHKGARHGLKLSGKLARLEQQEKELLAQMQANANKLREDAVKMQEDVESKKNKRKALKAEAEMVETKKEKKIKKQKLQHLNEVKADTADVADADKTQQKRKAREEQELTALPELKAKKKKIKQQEAQYAANDEQQEEVTINNNKKKKHKKHCNL